MTLGRLAATAAITMAAVVITTASSQGRAFASEQRIREIATTDEELAGPSMPRPFVLPDLLHDGLDVGVGWLVGSGSAPRDDRSNPVLALSRAWVEDDFLLPRRFYLGATIPLASALSPDGTSGGKTLFGNVEAHARIVFPLPSWLAFGAVLGVVMPTSRYGRGSGAHRAAASAASLEPTDFVHFEPDAFALRPAFDMRIVRGAFIAQGRQGIDVAVDSRSGRTVTTGRFLGHLGVHWRRRFELSFEATQTYLFDDKVSDSRRTAITMGPGVRVSAGSVDIGAAFVTSVFAPLSTDLDRFVAARVSLVAHLD